MRATPTGATARRSLRPVLGLGMTQIVSYGTLYYAFAVLAPAIAADLDRSTAWVFGCFSLALLVGGIVGPASGHLIDRYGARRTLGLGSLAAAASLAALAGAEGPTGFLLALVAVEVASTLTQYDAAFAAIAQGRDERAARAAITQVTILGGFASTLFWPATHWLSGMLDWRAVYLVFAALHLLVCLPIHLVVLRDGRAAAAGAGAAEPDAAQAGSVPRSRRLRAMILVVLSFCLTGFAFSAVNVHWMSALEALGLSAGLAVAAGALMGPAQVGVRVLDLVLGRRLDPAATAGLAIAFLVAALAVLLAAGTSHAGVAAFAILFGLSQGLTSIVRGTLPLALFGREGYGARLGTITAIRLVVTAGAPFAFALLVAEAGPSAAFAAMAVMATAAFGALAAIPRLTPASRPPRGGRRAGPRPRSRRSSFP